MQMGRNSSHVKHRARHNQRCGSHPVGHVLMGARGFDNEHGFGNLPNKRRREIILRTEYVSERMITTEWKHQQRRIVLTRVYHLHENNYRKSGLQRKLFSDK